MYLGSPAALVLIRNVYVKNNLYNLYKVVKGVKALTRGFRTNEKGQALIEYTILMGLLGLMLVVAVANVADQILDIWNDLMEDLDTIDDCVADLDVECPESNEDDGNEDDTVGGGYQ